MSDLILPNQPEDIGDERAVIFQGRVRADKRFSELPGKERALLLLICEGFIKSQFSRVKDEIEKDLTVEIMVEKYNSGDLKVLQHSDGTYSLFLFKNDGRGRYEELANLTIKVE